MSRTDADWDALIERATAIVETERVPPRRRAAALGNRGVAWHNKGDTDRALTDFAAAIETDPSYARGYFARGTARLNAGEIEGAIADFSEAIRLAPGYALAHHNRALARQRQGHANEAMADFTDAIGAEPLSAVSYVGRGMSGSTATISTAPRPISTSPL